MDNRSGNLTVLLVAVLLFVGTPLLNKIGYPHAQESAVFYFKLHPATYIACLLMFSHLRKRKSWRLVILKEHINAVWFMLMIIFVVLYLYLLDRANNIGFIFDTFLTASFFVITYSDSKNHLHKKIYKLVQLFFFVTCVLAIAERGFNFNLLEPAKGVGDNGFRATALQGHPLNNALITVVIMSFIYLSEVKHKSFLLLLGTIALVSFGARGALIGMSVLTVLFILYNQFFKSKGSHINVPFKAKSKSMVPQVALIVTCIAFSFYLITETKYGERLTGVSYYDEGSASTRIDVLNVFTMVDTSDLMFGVSQQKLDTILRLLNIPIIENFWIQWILKFGVILTVIFTIFLTRLLIVSLKGYKKVEKIYLILVMIVVASTNNSLAISTPVISIFLICCKVFNPSKMYISDRLRKANQNLKLT
jgi:hypothetical protein